jgi:hypothetical protein
MPLYGLLFGLGMLGISYLVGFNSSIGQWTTTFGIVFTIIPLFAFAKVKQLRRMEEN